MIKFISLISFFFFSLCYGGVVELSNVSNKTKDYKTLSQVDISVGGKMMLKQYAQKNNLGDDILLTYHCKNEKKVSCKMIRIDSTK